MDIRDVMNDTRSKIADDIADVIKSHGYEFISLKDSITWPLNKIASLISMENGCCHIGDGGSQRYFKYMDSKELGFRIYHEVPSSGHVLVIDVLLSIKTENGVYQKPIDIFKLRFDESTFNHEIIRIYDSVDQLLDHIESKQWKFATTEDIAAFKEFATIIHSAL